jgi:hypothetical protein
LPFLGVYKTFCFSINVENKRNSFYQLVRTGISKINNPIQFNLLDSENSDINLDDIAPIVIPENPPWLNPKPTFNFELTKYKKSETNPLLIQQHFAEVRSVTSEYSAIYTDGSKDGDRGSSNAFFAFLSTTVFPWIPI